eukprot:GFUD01000030.1.p2 GENE.GFUD01000030.1~~GFUD01000030.1.p2  ORF type:complete len:101 (-),score=26.50 GFUD01000030.1:343-645(-)
MFVTNKHLYILENLQLQFQQRALQHLSPMCMAEEVSLFSLQQVALQERTKEVIARTISAMPAINCSPYIASGQTSERRKERKRLRATPLRQAKTLALTAE